MILSSLSFLPPSSFPNAHSDCPLLVTHPLSSQSLLPCVCGSTLRDGSRAGQSHEAALHLLHEEGGGGGHHCGGMVLQA